MGAGYGLEVASMDLRVKAVALVAGGYRGRLVLRGPAIAGMYSRYGAGRISARRPTRGGDRRRVAPMLQREG